MNLPRLSIKRPVFATMLIAVLMVFGLMSYPKVGVDLYPEVEFPVITVTVVYPGVDPSTMEDQVAKPLEDAVNTMSGIRALRSVNLEGVTQVITEFELGVSADQAVQDIRDRISRIQRDLPAGADPAIVEKFDIGATPVMTLALAGAMSVEKLTDLADDVVKARIQRVAGVGGVDVVGGQKREIHVLVDAEKLAGFELSVDDVASAIRAQNVEIPAGSYSAGTQEITVKTKGEVRSVEAIAGIRIPAARGANIHLRDVARIEDSKKRARSASFLDGEPAISLVVRKQSGSNTVAVAHAIRDEIAALEPELTKVAAKVTIPTDNSTFIEHSIDDVEFDLIFGAFLAIVVIFFFLLDFRATLISAVAIPTSVIATFAFIDVMGFTFNQMTMLALSLAIGILIDDAIVVIENIHRHLEQGKPSADAAGDATSEIFLAVLAMTSTIIAVFVPVAIMKGIVGRFFLQFGLTVSFAVAVSMLVSFTLTPMLSSRFLASTHGKKKGPLTRFVDGSMGLLERAYGRVISWSLRQRAATIGLAVLMLVASGALVTRVPTEFVPAEDRGEFAISVELPTGTSLETTTEYVKRIAADARANIPGVTQTLATIGGGAQGQPNKGSIGVKIVKAKTRKYSQQDLMAWARTRYEKTPGALVTLGQIDSVGGGASQPIQLSIRGDDMDELVLAAKALQAELAKTPGFVDVDTTHRGGKPELGIDIDRERAADLGIPVATIATTVRALLAGDAASELKQGSNTYDIVVQLPVEEQSRIANLSNLKVRSTSGALIELSNVVHTEATQGASIIERQARQRQITVLANLDGLALGDATGIVDAAVKRVVPAKLNTEYAGSTQIMTESFAYMIQALLLAILLVYMILAVQFESFVQPLTIMISLPMSVIGAFGALYVTNMTLSIFSMIGVIMLMGLVTKNAILLVDFANQLRQQGLEMFEALSRAGRLRLRPILMTTIAMIFGMLPVALALGEGGETRAPMAVCVIGGLITSTLLTLILVPVVYSLLEGLTHSRAVRWLESKVFAGSGPGAHATPAEGSQSV